MDDLEAVRRALAARVDSCWDRLAAVASELHTVHAVPTAEIVQRVVATCAEEDRSEIARNAAEAGQSNSNLTRHRAGQAS